MVNASYGYDVIETRTNLRIHAGQAELRRRDGFIRLSRADEDLRLDSHAVEIDFHAVARIRRGGIQIERVEGDRHQVRRRQCVWKIEVIAQFGVTASEAAFGSLFIDRNRTDWGVVAVVGDDGRVRAGEIVIIVSLSINLRAVRNSRQRVGNSIFLHKGGVGSPTVTYRPSIIIEANRPREHRRRDSFGLLIKLDIVDTHPIAATVGIVIDASQAHDVIKARTNFCVHTGQSELRGRVILIQLSSADENLRLDQHSIDIDFDAIARVRLVSLQIVRVKGDR